MMGWGGGTLYYKMEDPLGRPCLLRCWRRPCLDVLGSPSLFSQVSRFLVVNPQGRCSAEEALAHPFFQQYVVEEVRHFSPRGKFKVLKFPCHRGPCGRIPQVQAPKSPSFPQALLSRTGFPEHLSLPSTHPCDDSGSTSPGIREVRSHPPGCNSLHLCRQGRGWDGRGTPARV